MKAFAIYHPVKKKYLIKTGRDSWWNLTDNPLGARLYEDDALARKQIKSLNTMAKKADPKCNKNLFDMQGCVLAEVNNPTVTFEMAVS